MNRLLPLFLLALASCGGQTTGAESREPVAEEHTGYRLEYAAGDRAVAQSLVPMIDRGRQSAEQYFGTTYPTSFIAHLYPDRTSLTARWRVAWNQPTLETQCWMIAAGWAAELDILSPSVWGTQACSHDGGNASHVANVVAHELVHVLQGQRNSGFTALAATTPWITEGLATFASGQWAAEYAGSVRAFVSASSPGTFADLWATNANYALAGSVFAYINQRYGADILRRALTVRTEAEIFSLLSTDATTLLRDWRTWVLG